MGTNSSFDGLETLAGGGWYSSGLSNNFLASATLGCLYSSSTISTSDTTSGVGGGGFKTGLGVTIYGGIFSSTGRGAAGLIMRSN